MPDWEVVIHMSYTEDQVCSLYTEMQSCNFLGHLG